MKIVGVDMPSSDTVVRTVRIKNELDQKLHEFMDKEDLTYSSAVSRLIDEMDMPKSRREYVNTDKFIEACERTNQDAQYIIDKITDKLLKGR